MLNKPQTIKLSRALNLFAQEVIASGIKTKELEKDLNTDRPLPIKSYKLVKQALESVIGEYMASRNADKFLAVVYESVNPRVPDTAFGPFASAYEANNFARNYEVMAMNTCDVTPGFADLVKFRDPTFPFDALQDAMAERREEVLSETWCSTPNPFWRPPAATADVPKRLQKRVEAFLRKAAQIGERLQAKRTTREQAKDALKEEGIKLADVGGGWGALNYAFWRLRNDGLTVETINAQDRAMQDMGLMTHELLNKIKTERLWIDELEDLLVDVLYSWTGIAGWAP